MSGDLRHAFLACTRGDIGMLQKYVPSTVDANSHIFQWLVSSVPSRHVAMLHVAAGSAKEECVGYLIANGADVNMPDLMIPSF